MDTAVEAPRRAGECRLFEVVVTVACGDDGEPLVPYALPPGVRGWWLARSVTVKAMVTAASASLAVAAVEAIVPDLACAPGVTVNAHAPSEEEWRRDEETLAFFRAKAAQADPEKVARMLARTGAQEQARAAVDGGD